MPDFESEIVFEILLPISTNSKFFLERTIVAVINQRPTDDEQTAALTSKRIQNLNCSYVAGTPVLENIS